MKTRKFLEPISCAKLNKTILSSIKGKVNDCWLFNAEDNAVQSVRIIVLVSVFVIGQLCVFLLFG